ncbi:hypothetical protein FACS189416_5340 [Bacteroidia bacterium]|nr:hypothetical protein FACS189416_5340 [Bacteroidia bacterium]
MKMKSIKISEKAILIIIGIGVWIIVFQNVGIIPTNQHVKIVNTVDTYVTGGSIDSNISGSVNVDNTVDVNIHEINGHNQVTTGIGTHSVFPYGYMLPVDNW